MLWTRRNERPTALPRYPDHIHAFDRGSAVERVDNASVSPSAPTAYLADNGAFFHPLDDTAADPALVDRDLMIYSLKAGYGRTGATIGSKGDDAAIFRADMEAFWQGVFA